jgi:hypothetical protein
MATERDGRLERRRFRWGAGGCARLIWLLRDRGPAARDLGRTPQPMATCKADADASSDPQTAESSHGPILDALATGAVSVGGW